MQTPSFLRSDVDVTRWTSFSTPAKSRYVFELLSVDDVKMLPLAFEFAESSGLPVLFVWSGTNLLFAFDEYPGIILRSKIRGIEVSSDGKTCSVWSGESVIGLCHALIKGWWDTTFVPWSGLPGTVGGACMGNAGCFWLETSEILVSGDFANARTGVIERIPANEFGFTYRSTRFKGQNDRFLVSVQFALGREPNVTLGHIAAFRQERQPKWNTCGSYYKNPPWKSAGALIDAAGLKWFRIGSARISDLHANFFLNDEGGWWKDILALDEHVRSAVFSTFGISLEPEVRILSNN